MAVQGLFWIELGLGVALLLLTAKAHGRQIRLERELEGYMEVDFMKDNPPWVEALWRKDRRRFWATLPVAIAVASVAGLLTLPSRFGTDPLNNPVLGTVLLAGLLWPFAVTFTSNGLQSAARHRKAVNEKVRSRSSQAHSPMHPDSSVRSAARGTLLYWGSIVGLGAIAILAALS